MTIYYLVVVVDKKIHIKLNIQRVGFVMLHLIHSQKLNYDSKIAF